MSIVAPAVDPAVSTLAAHLDAQKRSMRNDMRVQRARLALTERRRRSDRACTHLLTLPPVQSAAVLAGYRALEGEADPGAALADVAARGQVVAYPRVSRLRPRLRFHRVNGHGDLHTGAFGVAEPDCGCPEVPAAAVDVFIVPGLAFDRHGGRLGFGGGYYDELVAWLRPDGGAPGAARRGLLVGFAFDFQVLAHVPTGPADGLMDLLVTENRIVVCRPDLDRRLDSK